MKHFDIPPGIAGTRPLRVCMLAYTFYENDGRVMRYAEALAQVGAEVEAIVLRRGEQPPQETVNGIRVLRIQKREKNETGKYAYLMRILRFFFRSMLEVTRRHVKAPYDVIHVHSVPDFEVFAACIAKWLGARIILDIHDIVPEFYAAKFHVSQQSLSFKALRLMEKASASFADHVIIANDLWLEKITSRSIRRDKCSAFINYPDFSIFHAGLRSRRPDGKFVAIYPGTLNWHQGVDIAVKAVHLARSIVPTIELHIYGEGSAKPQLQKLIEDLGLSDCVILRPPLKLREIAAVMANADLGVVPKRNDSFGGEAFSTKILEFMALGVPVVVAKTKIDQYYFDDSLVAFFDAGNERDLARALVKASEEQVERLQRAARALQYVRQIGWNSKKGEYFKIVRGLLHAPE